MSAPKTDEGTSRMGRMPRSRLPASRISEQDGASSRIFSRVAHDAFQLFRSHAHCQLCINVGQAFGEAFAFGIDQRCRAGTCYRINRPGDLDVTGERWFDHVSLDDAEILRSTLVRVAITFDQAGTFGDFKRKLTPNFCRLSDERQPALDGALLFIVTIGAGAPAPQFCQRPEAQETRHRHGVYLHAPVPAMQPGTAVCDCQQATRQTRWQDRTQFVYPRLEEFRNANGIAGA